ncbi:MAG: BBE domain-containing protein [Ornithinibacter sp.]
MCTEPPQKVIGGGSAKSGGQFADIKTKYDPPNIFHRNANIAPTSL